MPEGLRPWIADAIRDGGGAVVGVAEAEGLVWADTASADALADLLGSEGRQVRWIQLPYAGVEPFVEVISQYRDRTWTCAKGVYADPVAEHALMLLLAGLRGLGVYGRASTWLPPQGTNLIAGSKRAKIVIVGGGGITESLLRLLQPFGAEITVVRRHPDASGMSGANRVVPMSELDDALTDAIGVVLALALTAETKHLIGRSQLSRMARNGWIVNVARGGHIVTDDLVAVLQEGLIGGAALDVTDPEPLPDGHPLWELSNCIITPHVGNTPEMAVPLLAARIAENVRRWSADETLLGLVDPALGY
jgi:phosphoglycerate dehydrogenase-like enzyme